MLNLSATYSPEDNKLRLYASDRLDADLLQRVKDAGFKYAPAQRLFFAPSWSPKREDFLLELCGSIGDESLSLAERAADRADRFESYSVNRQADAHKARTAADSISKHIPFGQPILIGHHSEGRARRDAQRIEDGQRKSVKMWEASEYWKERAEAARAHAQYKALPAVRVRRLIDLEAEKRKQERYLSHAQAGMTAWTEEGITHERAIEIARIAGCVLPRKEGDSSESTQGPSASDLLANRYPSLYVPRTLQEIIEGGQAAYCNYIVRVTRWIQHFENRIIYERIMLSEQGCLAAESADLKAGGSVLINDEWFTILRVNKRDGKAVSVTTTARRRNVRPVEEIKEYKAPSESAAQAAKKATAVPPIANYPGEGFITMTKDEFEKSPKDFRCFRRIPGDDKAGAHRMRAILGTFAPAAQMAGRQRHDYYMVFLTDEKQKNPPAPTLVAVAA
jgi:hypothetical protein